MQLICKDDIAHASIKMISSHVGWCLYKYKIYNHFYILQLYTVNSALQPPSCYYSHFILTRIVNLVLSRRIRSRGMHVRFRPFRNRLSFQTAWWRTRVTIFRRLFQSITKKSLHDGLSSKGKISKPALNQCIWLALFGGLNRQIITKT